MKNTQLENKLLTLFDSTAKAHHEAYSATDGDDPEWPIWYADYLQQPISKIFNKPFLKSQLIYCLMNVDNEFTAREIKSAWQKYYSNHFLVHFSPSATPAEDSLALYYSPTCPFCKMVLHTIDQLGVKVELRNIDENTDFLNELVTARNRATVPVLHITSPDGDKRWMPESRDIIRYLENTYQ